MSSNSDFKPGIFGKFINEYSTSAFSPWSQASSNNADACDQGEKASALLDDEYCPELEEIFLSSFQTVEQAERIHRLENGIEVVDWAKLPKTALSYPPLDAQGLEHSIQADSFPAVEVVDWAQLPENALFPDHPLDAQGLEHSIQADSFPAVEVVDWAKLPKTALSYPPLDAQGLEHSIQAGIAEAPFIADSFAALLNTYLS